MAQSETLSVRLSFETRQMLDTTAEAQKIAGASALARDILERWAALERDNRITLGIARAAAYLSDNPDGWADDPADFFCEHATPK